MQEIEYVFENVESDQLIEESEETTIDIARNVQKSKTNLTISL